jgi:hypothetical protein
MLSATAMLPSTLPLTIPLPLECVEEAAGLKRVPAAAWCHRRLSRRCRSRRARPDAERDGHAAADVAADDTAAPRMRRGGGLLSPDSCGGLPSLVRVEAAGRLMLQQLPLLPPLERIEAARRLVRKPPTPLTPLVPIEAARRLSCRRCRCCRR